MTTKKKKNAQKPPKRNVPPKPPTKYDPIKHPELVIDYLAQGYSIRSLIAKLDISHQTFQAWRSHIEFKEAIDIGKAKSEEFYIKMGQDMAQGKIKGGSATAWIFLCKNLIGWKDSTEEKQDAQPITINFGIAPKPE